MPTAIQSTNGNGHVPEMGWLSQTDQPPNDFLEGYKAHESEVQDVLVEFIRKQQHNLATAKDVAVKLFSLLTDESGQPISRFIYLRPMNPAHNVVSVLFFVSREISAADGFDDYYQVAWDYIEGLEEDLKFDFSFCPYEDPVNQDALFADGYLHWYPAARSEV